MGRSPVPGSHGSADTGCLALSTALRQPGVVPKNPRMECGEGKPRRADARVHPGRRPGEHQAVHLLPVLTMDQPEPRPIEFSNAVRLSGRQWVGIALFGVAFLLVAPDLWKRLEPFDLEADYRMPHELNNDYWLFERYASLAAQRYDTLIIGDSVVWGEYAKRDETLSHYLSKECGADRFANLGLDGAHPLALTGLIRHYAGRVAGRNVVLECNPLWLS